MARKLTLDFLKTEAGSGPVLGLAAVAALVVANSPLAAGLFRLAEERAPAADRPARGWS